MEEIADETPPMDISMHLQICNGQNQPVQIRGRAQWARNHVIIFCDICKKEFDDSGRSGGNMKKLSWKKIANKFKNKTGVTYTSDQMKNKWDHLKKEWKNWGTLKRLSTGLGWNPQKGTVDASDDWWEKSIKVSPEIAKFRTKGIDPELDEKYEALFLSAVAKGDDTWVPSANHPSERFLKVSCIQNASPNAVSSDRTFSQNETGETVDGFPSLEPTKIRPNKRAKLSSTTQQKKTEKVKVGSSMLYSKMDEIKECLENHRNAIKSRLDRLPPTITDAVEVLITMEKDVPEFSSLYRFATNLFLNKDKREMFMALKSYSARLWYLNVEEKEAKTSEAHSCSTLFTSSQ